MDSANINVCIKCSIGQYCCRNLIELRLSKIEYKQHFAKHSDNLEVRQDTGIYIVSSKEEFSCPKWVGEKCTIYEDRPMECRLFPYTIGRIIQKGNRINITFHSRTPCPMKGTLLMPKVEATRMLMSFARSVFSNVDKINIEHEWLFTRLKYKILRFITSR